MGETGKMTMREAIEAVLQKEFTDAGERVLAKAAGYPAGWTEVARQKFLTTLRFAAFAHRGVTRKGTETPYIFHPLEAALVVLTMTDDIEVVQAALLHDVVEDTAYECEDIEVLFGRRVAELVAHESEDKMADRPAAETWQLRKEQALQSLAKAPLDAKMVCLGDKLSNMRQTVITYADKGEAMWQDFNQKDHLKQAWYYKTLAAALAELAATPAYKEYMDCCGKVFGAGMVD